MKKALLLITIFAAATMSAQLIGDQSHQEYFDGASSPWEQRGGGTFTLSGGHAAREGVAQDGNLYIDYNPTGTPSDDAGNPLTLDPTFDKYIAVKYLGTAPSSLQMQIAHSGSWSAKKSPVATFTTSAGNQVQYYDLVDLLGTGYTGTSYNLNRVTILGQNSAGTNPAFTLDWIATFASVAAIDAAKELDDDLMDISERVLSTKNLILENLSIYPNPTKGLVSFKTSKSLNADLTVYNAFGKSILTKHISDLESQVDISNFASGMYLFKVESKEGVLTKRVIKQ